MKDEYIEHGTYGLLVCFAFFVFLLAVFLKSGLFSEGQEVTEYLKEGNTTDSRGVSDYDRLEISFLNKLHYKNRLIDLNGYIARRLGMRGLYGNDLNMYITKDDYIVSYYPQTSTDYEYEQIINLKDYLDEKGIKLLYVNEPSKYVNDKLMMDEFGLDSYLNRNMDLFMQRIREAGINVIDLREVMVKEDINVRDMFYRTDHHWNVNASLWAAKETAKGLNDYCDYDIDLKIYNKENYIQKEYKSSWLGEQGRKLGRTYVGLDDFTEIKPKFETSFNIVGEMETATFDNMVKESVYYQNTSVYDATSWHYSYKRGHFINNNVDRGKLLIVGDSYQISMQPFLSLGIHDTDCIFIRDFERPFSLRTYIEQGEYDTVLIAYSQSMLGAHDQPGSSNYYMFDFE